MADTSRDEDMATTGYTAGSDDADMDMDRKSTTQSDEDMPRRSDESST